MQERHLWQGLAFGAMAGIAGTVALQLIRQADQKLLPGAQAPMRDDPGRFMVHQVERLLPYQTRQRIHERIEPKATPWLGLAYGATFGALYGALHPAERGLLWKGAALGIVTWAAGFLGWLPATGLMPPVHRQKLRQVMVPLAEHALFGLATVLPFHLLRRWRDRKRPALTGLPGLTDTREQPTEPPEAFETAHRGGLVHSHD